MSTATIETLTSSGKIVSVNKDTSAVNKYNDKDFSNLFNNRIQGLYSFLQNRLIYGGNPDTTYKLPLKDFIDYHDFTQQEYLYYRPSTTIYNYFIKSLWENIYQVNIPDIMNSFVALNEIFGIKVEIVKTEKEQFISDYSLDEAIHTAYRLINTIFEDLEIQTELYIDPEEPQYKFLNVSIIPTNVSESEIHGLLDKFDGLQEQFLIKVDKKYASRITFHLDIT